MAHYRMSSGRRDQRNSPSFSKLTDQSDPLFDRFRPLYSPIDNSLSRPLPLERPSFAFQGQPLSANKFPQNLNHARHRRIRLNPPSLDCKPSPHFGTVFTIDFFSPFSINCNHYQEFKLIYLVDFFVLFNSCWKR
jgi:hypothetical protein